MRKEILTKHVQHVILCDLCQKDCTGFTDNCWLCRREVCYRCRKLLFCGKHDDLVEFAIKVCSRCREGNSETIAEIESALVDVNRRLRATVDVWRESVKQVGR